MFKFNNNLLNKLQKSYLFGSLVHLGTVVVFIVYYINLLNSESEFYAPKFDYALFSLLSLSLFIFFIFGIKYKIARIGALIFSGITIIIFSAVILLGLNNFNSVATKFVPYVNFIELIYAYHFDISYLILFVYLGIAIFPGLVIIIGTLLKKEIFNFIYKLPTNNFVFNFIFMLHGYFSIFVCYVLLFVLTIIYIRLTITSMNNTMLAWLIMFSWVGLLPLVTILVRWLIKKFLKKFDFILFPLIVAVGVFGVVIMSILGNGDASIYFGSLFLLFPLFYIAIAERSRVVYVLLICYLLSSIGILIWRYINHGDQSYLIIVIYPTLLIVLLAFVYKEFFIRPNLPSTSESKH